MKTTNPEDVGYSFQPFIQTKWLKPGNRSSRIKATNLTTGKYVVVSWDNALTVAQNHLQAAQALYRKENQDMPHSFIMCGSKDEKGYIMTEDRS